MRVAVVGSYGVGLTMQVSRVPEPGETVTGGTFAEGPGGKGSNQAVGAARLGAQVDLFTAVGDDSFGRAAHTLWAGEGIDASTVRVVDAATMVGVILVDATGENRIAIAPGALDRLTPADLDAFVPAIAAADVLVVSLEIPLPVALRALELGRSNGTRTLLNPAPACALPDEAWPLIDVLTPNEMEAPVLLGASAQGLDAAGVVAELRARTGGAVVLTRGARGVVVSDEGGSAEVPAVPATRVVDTTGAGDSFTAALAVRLAEGAALTDAVHFAAHAGAHTVSIPGVIPALPRRDELASLIGQPR